MSKRASIFCKRGIGDSLQHLLLAQNLHKNGYEVDFFSDALAGLEPLFSYVRISPLSAFDIEGSALASADLVLIKSDSHEAIKRIIHCAKKNNPLRTWVIHPTTCKTRKKLPGDLSIDPTHSMVWNLERFCINQLKLEGVTNTNGIEIPPSWEYRKEPKRVILHPTSSLSEKNWPAKKFSSLCRKLIRNGFSPLLIMTKKERESFPCSLFENISIVDDLNLLEIAKLIYSSGYFIGNDSGMGHLASNLKIPTVTIFSIRRKRHLWRPAWGRGETVASFPIFPNCKLLRLQNRYWDISLTVPMVWRAFLKIQ